MLNLAWIEILLRHVLIEDVSDDASFLAKADHCRAKIAGIKAWSYSSSPGIFISPPRLLPHCRLSNVINF